MMDLQDLDIMRFLSGFMRNDKTSQGLAYAFNKVFKECASDIDKVLIYANIDNLPENIIDSLAWQFHVDFYEADFTLAQKRQAVKSALVIHKTKGTPYAIKRLIADTLGKADVYEWFQYGGDPYHFRVLTTQANIEDEAMIIKLTAAIMSVKNVRSVFDGFYAYNTHGSLAIFTHDDLSDYTHDQLSNEVIT